MVPLAATEQSGVFTREQALAEGWTPSQVEHRLRTGAWRRLAGRALIRGDVTPSAWSGVWAVHLTWLTAVASHLTAAAAHRMPVPAGPVHATAGLRLRSLKDLVVHRVPLPAVQVLRVGAHGPLLTTPLRSAMDCLRILPEDDAVRLLGWCLTRGVLTREDLVAEVGEAAGRHGNRALLALLRRTAGGALSEAERLFHTLLRRAGITGWAANAAVRVDGLVVAVVDVLFDEPRVAVEIDGWSAHSDRESFERDRRRQNALVNAGYVVLRFTWRDLKDRPDDVVAELTAALRACGA